ncbi:MAG TPA: cupin domain-containing protein [Steroidobacteraceae bacterium]|nr:cupin domain-containing protein [Steroidobacteraceae bacterium]
MTTKKWRASAFVGCLLSAASALTMSGSSAAAVAHSEQGYAYATAGVMDQIHVAGIDWKILLNKSNLGGSELEMVEATFPAGMLSPSHTHKAVEIIYVLSGTYEHEVNGRLFRLEPGMTGIVRPGDHVRHIVPKSGPAKVLIIWAPASAPAFFQNIHSVAIPPVEPAKTGGPTP